jgi:radical SAM protein with 4Fe4S-binding SPASM domain
MFVKPLLVGIEPTNRCNLACRMCVRQHWNPGINPSGDMDQMFFMEKIVPFLSLYQTVNVQCLGEPLLAESFFLLVKACKRKGCRVCFTTNGTLLERYAGDIVASGVDEVTVSLDGIAAHEDIRGVSADTIAGGIRALAAAKEKRGSTRPHIAFNVVAMRDTVAELPDLVQLAATLGIRTITVMHAVIHSKELHDQSLFRDSLAAKRYFDEAGERARCMGISIDLPPLERRESICPQPCEMLYINWNGDVRPCCSATFNEPDTLKAGDLDRETLRDVWNNAYMRRLRLVLSRQKDMPGFCRKCFMRVCSADTQMRVLDGTHVSYEYRSS